MRGPVHHGDQRRKHLRERRDAAARKYMPERIDPLLVAEAPPVADDRYFYFENPTSNDWLFTGVAEVLLGRKPGKADKTSALARLRDRGVYLIDLKLDPVDGSDLKYHTPYLVSRCALLRPRRIILIKATVFDAAYESLKMAGLPVVNKRVYFPSTGRQKDFKKQFVEALES